MSHFYHVFKTNKKSTIQFHQTKKKLPSWSDINNNPSSMRQENHFHEEICEHVFKTLSDLLPNSKILVACLYTRRGGIDINPIRISDKSLLDEASFLNSLLDLKTPFSKTFRQ